VEFHIEPPIRLQQRAEATYERKEKDKGVLRMSKAAKEKFAVAANK